jgi:hypothetical protein
MSNLLQKASNNLYLVTIYSFTVKMKFDMDYQLLSQCVDFYFFHGD